MLVGSGSPAAAKAFQEDLGLGEIRIFSDPTRRAYELAGFRRGLLTLLRPGAVWNYLRAFLSGHRQKAKQGDALQQGGLLLIKPDGTIPFRQISHASGDHADLDDVLAVLRAAG